MKHLYLGLAILLVLLLASLWALWTLDRTAGQVAGLLEEAWDQSAQGKPAAGLVDRAMELWQSSHGLAASLVDHQKLEDVNQGFANLAAWLRLGDEEEFARGCLALAQQVRCIAESEKPYYFNIL